MAYMSQEKKAKLAPAIKAACSKYKVKATIAVRNHSTLVINIKSGKLDIIGNFNKRVDERDPTGTRMLRKAEDSLHVNTHWYHEHFDGRVKKFLEELITAANNGNHDRSDIMTDYFDVGWYLDINVGQWNKPYVLE